MFATACSALGSRDNVPLWSHGVRIEWTSPEQGFDAVRIASDLHIGCLYTTPRRMGGESRNMSRMGYVDRTRRSSTQPFLFLPQTIITPTTSITSTNTSKPKCIPSESSSPSPSPSSHQPRPPSTPPDKSNSATPNIATQPSNPASKTATACAMGTGKLPLLPDIAPAGLITDIVSTSTPAPPARPAA